MPSQVLSSVENNFTKGLITEFTGLNFPENAATDADNCEFSIVGDTSRRLGIDYETNFALNNLAYDGNAINSYKWNNAGGDGLTQVVVQQVGNKLYFFKSSDATTTNPLSTTLLASTVDISTIDSTITFDYSAECQFSDGNGYLFVYHPTCYPFYCTYVDGTITPNLITVQVRDFAGVPDGAAVSVRPLNLSDEHLYNLTNQGWVKSQNWTTQSTTAQTGGLGAHTFTVAAGLPITLGDTVAILNIDPITSGFRGGAVLFPASSDVMNGTVTAYAGTSITINVTYVATGFSGTALSNWGFVPFNKGFLNTWKTAIGNYPSNADVWWYFKNASGVYDPATTLSNVTQNAGSAPKGHFILNAFDFDRNGSASTTTITRVTTNSRPRTGAWFQGRVWYTGVDDSFPVSGDVSSFSWTENIYFSQIISDVSQFGNCYQTNDPTSETLFDLLPTDGGVITIQGAGSIYKLFPLQNALVVFASNGIWYITGSQGIGFAANDYTIVKLSSVKSISSTSIVDVNGFPYFWNEEGIYSVEPTPQENAPDSRRNALEVTPITVGTILSFYNEIPAISKKYARGAYNPIDYVIQWVYRSTAASTVNERYQYDKILNFNNHNKAFYPYTVSNTPTSLAGIIYVSSPGGTDASDPAFKYITTNNGLSTFAEEMDENYVDWASASVKNFTSYFVTGYKLHGQGQRRFQVPYVYIYSRASGLTSYKIQGIWDYAISGNSGRWSTEQLVNNWSPNFGMVFRRHKIRGQGLVLQLKITSSDGEPFDIMGWSTFETQNTGI